MALTSRYNGKQVNDLDLGTTYPWSCERALWREIAIPAEGQRLLLTIRNIPHYTAEGNPAGINAVAAFVGAVDGLLYTTFGVGESLTITQRPAGGPDGDYWGGASMDPYPMVPGYPPSMADAVGDLSEVWTYEFKRPVGENPELNVTGSMHPGPVFHWKMPVETAGMKLMIGWITPPALEQEFLEQTGQLVKSCVDIVYLGTVIENL